MALGDLVLFNKAKLALLDGTHDLDTHSFSLALLNNTTTPAATDAAPTLGAYTEVTAGGSYAAGGVALTVTLAEAAGTVTWDATNNPNWAQQAGSPTDAWWALIYNVTNAGKEAIGFVELAGPVDLTTTALTVAWNASGILTLT